MNKKKIILFSAATLGILCLVITLILIFGENDKAEDLSPLQYALHTVPMLPEEPGYADEYVYSRIPSETWRQEQVDEWFIIPEAQHLDQLKMVNDQIIRQILETAP